MSRTIVTDKTVLSFAVCDAVNMFIRDVLVAKGIITEEVIDNREAEIDEGLRVIEEQIIKSFHIFVSCEE
jgi:hypothetical protein